MPIANAFRLLTSRPGNQNDSGAIWALARTCPENCMTPKPAQTFIFFHLRPHWVRAKKVSFSLVFYLRKRGYGWGRNRTADTRIFSPLLCRLSYPAATTLILRRALGFPLCSNPVAGQGCQNDLAHH